MRTAAKERLRRWLGRMRSDRRLFLALNGGLAFGLTCIAAVIWLLRGVGPEAALAGSHGWPRQLLTGALLGAAAAGILGSLDIRMEYFRRIQEDVLGLIRRLRLGVADLAFISACAGWGEEILFRAGLQPVIGIWLSSALFALAHGTLTSLGPGPILYTGLLFAGSLGLGALYGWSGLLASASAHALYDFCILLILTREARRR